VRAEPTDRQITHERRGPAHRGQVAMLLELAKRILVFGVRILAMANATINCFWNSLPATGF